MAPISMLLNPFVTSGTAVDYFVQAACCPVVLSLISCNVNAHATLASDTVSYVAELAFVVIDPH